MNFSVDWDVALKIWAVVGPLLAAGASAIWSRRNQLQDREHDLEQQRISRAQALEDRDLEHKRNTLSSRKSELRIALAQFVAAANDYIHLWQKNSTAIVSAESRRLELDASARLNANYQTVSFLGTEELVSLAKKVLNLATDLPYKVPDLPEPEQMQYRNDYLQAKKDLSIAARKIFGIESEA